MLNKAARGLVSGESSLKFGDLEFEIVDKFKYLGVMFDAAATEKSMVSLNLEKGRKAYGWLHGFVK